MSGTTDTEPNASTGDQPVGTGLLFADLASTSRLVASTGSRNAKADAIAALLGRAAADPEALAVTVTYLSGELRQRRTGVGWRSLTDLPDPVGSPSLTVLEVDATFAEVAEMSGAGSRGAKTGAVAGLFGRATSDEQWLLGGLVSGELRQGALDGVMAEAVARATGIDAKRIRAAIMMAGGAPPVAVAALTEGEAGLAQFTLQVGQPVQPMLAASAQSVAEALDKLHAGGYATARLDHKLDGIRIQVHRDGDEVRVFTRSLDDVTARSAAVVDVVRALECESVVLDGELMAVRADGRPQPFQVTGSRTATSPRAVDPDAAAVAAADEQHDGGLVPFFFDVLYLDGSDLTASGTAERHAALTRIVPPAHRIPQLVVPTEAGDADARAQAEQWFVDAIDAGQEGVMVKGADAPYEAGRRGSAWIKVKQIHTLDLVVLAAEWGSGRRTGWLSNIHLGARADDPPVDPDDPDGYVMLGKTFKGMTDELLKWQTDEFPAYESGRTQHEVRLKPHFVVEIALDGVQTSRRYPAGMALRFARVLRYRPDKSPAEADTVATVRAIHER